MSAANQPCDLCMLPVADDAYHLQTEEGIKRFCCEGCRGIFQMLNGGVEIAAAGQPNQTEDKGEQT